MLIAFLIWSLVFVLLITIAITMRFSKKPVGLFANAKPPTADEISDVKAYNRAVSRLMLVFAIVYELLGLPLLFSEQNLALFLICIPFIMFSAIGTMAAYVMIEKKYKKK